MIGYHAVFEPAGEGGFVVTFPDFGWGVTQGETEAEAIEMAEDALRAMIMDTIKAGEALPPLESVAGAVFASFRFPH
jgi:antitoxin HicB